MGNLGKMQPRLSKHEIFRACRRKCVCTSESPGFCRSGVLRGARRTLRTAHPITSSLSDAASNPASLPALHSTEAAFCRLLASRSILRISFQSELHDRKTRDTTKVAEIDGQHRVAKRQSCGTDEQVSERNNHTLALLLSVEFPGQHRRLFRVRVHGQVRQQFSQERFTAQTNGWSFCTIEAVDEFRQTDRGERCILVASHVYHSLDEVLDRISTPLGSDDHAGVEDQSHAGGFRGSRWLLMTSSRSRAKSPSSVAVEPCSLARRRESDNSRT